MSIIIDYREQLLINLYDKALIKVENMNIGDIKIIHNEYEIIIERKTVADFISSVKDGRYKEQKIRLITYKKENPQFRIILYIIEGDYITINHPFYTENDRNILFGILISNALRDNIAIFSSKDIYSSKLFIDKLVSRMMKDASELFETNKTNDNYVSSIKLKRKDNITADTLWCIILSQIPGVSVNIAEIIIKSYPTLIALLDKYKSLQTTTEKELLLSELILSNGRKLGKILSARIYNLLFTGL